MDEIHLHDLCIIIIIVIICMYLYAFIFIYIELYQSKLLDDLCIIIIIIIIIICVYVCMCPHIYSYTSNCTSQPVKTVRYNIFAKSTRNLYSRNINKLLNVKALQRLLVNRTDNVIK